MRIFFEYGSKILLNDVEHTVIRMEDCENIEICGGYFRHVEPLDSENCHGSVFLLLNSYHISFDYCQIRDCGQIGFHVNNCSS